MSPPPRHSAHRTVDFAAGHKPVVSPASQGAALILLEACSSPTNRSRSRKQQGSEASGSVLSHRLPVVLPSLHRQPPSTPPKTPYRFSGLVLRIGGNYEGNQQDSSWREGGSSPAALSDLPKEPACEAAFSADFRSCSVREAGGERFYTTAWKTASVGTGGKKRVMRCIWKRGENVIRNDWRRKAR